MCGGDQPEKDENDDEKEESKLDVMDDTASLCTGALPAPQANTAAVMNPYLKLARTEKADTEIPKPLDVSRDPVGTNATGADVSHQNEAASDGHVSEAKLPAAVDPENVKAVSASSERESDAAWERLPSRNVSYDAAEVLTVSELCQHGPLHYENRSVRVTGVVLQKHVISSEQTEGYANQPAIVCFIIGDPLVTSQQRRPQRGQSLMGGSVTKHHPYARPSPAAASALQTPAARRNNPLKTPASKLHGIRSSSVASRHETPGTSLLVRKNGLASSKTPRVLVKRPLTSSMKTPRRDGSPIESMAACLLEHPSSSVLVVSRSSNIGTPGDLVMVMGEVLVSRPTDDSDGLVGIPGHPDFLLTLWNRIGNNGRQSDGPPPFFVEARILRNVNGTDMRLHEEALQIRRRFMLQTYDGSSTGILPGCGPPPYESMITNDNGSGS